MAISFPTTPVDGDIYTSPEGRSFKYNATLSAWTFYGGGADTPVYLVAKPTNPEEGALFYDTTTDVFEVYNETTGAWEPATAPAATPHARGTLHGITDVNTQDTIIGYKYSSVNPLYNGDGLNTFIGYELPYDTLTTAQSCVTIGTYCGSNISSARDTVLIGKDAGYNVDTTSYTVVVGTSSAVNVETGFNRSVAIGSRAANNANGANDCIAIGYQAMEADVTGTYMIAIGPKSLQKINSNNTVVIGTYGTQAHYATEPTIPDGTFILARPSTTDNTLLRINENNAVGIPTSNGSTTVDYGSSGEVLTSQGSGSPPIWAAAGGTPNATVSSVGTVYGLTGASAASDVFLGYLAGENTTTGGTGSTVLVGTYAGRNASSTASVIIGGSAWGGSGPRTGDYNVIIGQACAAIGSGSSNILIGRSTSSQHNGDGNIAIGTDVANINGSGNVIIGSYTGNLSNAYNESDTILLTYGGILGGTYPKASIILIKGNSSGAWGLWDGNTTLASSVSNYGSAGDILTSQGSTAPPQWVTGASGTFTAGSGEIVTVTNGIITSIV